MSELKLCIDCANYKRGDCNCRLNLDIDLVYGESSFKLQPEDLRKKNGGCGVSGKWWRSKDEKPTGKGAILRGKKK